MTATATPASSSILLPSSSPKYNNNSAMAPSSNQTTSSPQANQESTPTRHWSQKMHDSVLSSQVIEHQGSHLLYSKIRGGSDNGQFVYFDSALKCSSPNDEACNGGAQVWILKQFTISYWNFFRVVSLLLHKSLQNKIPKQSSCFTQKIIITIINFLVLENCNFFCIELIFV